MRKKVKITILESRCRLGTCKKGDEYVFWDVCPPVCAKLWGLMWPEVLKLHNGGEVETERGPAKWFEADCPDGSFVRARAETVEDDG